MKKKAIFAAIAIGCLTLVSCSKPIAESKPIRKDILETVFASGYLEAEDTYNLTAQTEGYLSKVNFEEGSIIKKGNILAEIFNRENIANSKSAQKLFDIAKENISLNSPQIKQALETLELTQKRLSVDSINLEKFSKLVISNSVSRNDYINAEYQFHNSQTNYLKALENLNLVKQQAEQDLIIKQSQKEITSYSLGYNMIEAVLGGKVYKKFKNAGDFVRKGEVIAVIGNKNNLYAKVSIDESNISKIKEGQKAVIQLNTNKKKSYAGYVKQILPSFNEETQSFECKVYFSEQIESNLFNTQLQVNIVINDYKNALVIPRNFLYYGNNVLIKGNDNPIKIDVNLISNYWVQVVSGIDENTVIQTDNVK